MADKGFNEQLVIEEQEYLDEVINRMDEELLRLNKQWTKKDLDSKKQKDACLPDTYGSFIDDQNDKARIKNEMGFIEQGRDELYQHRLILDYKDEDDGEEGVQDLKVGLDTYSKDGSIFIYSWVNPACRPFILEDDVRENTTEVMFHGRKCKTQYTLKEKRKIDLDFDRVMKAVRLYSEDKDDDEEVLYDEFLNELLERRSETEFKNIVFTIQKKQGQIIQIPFKQNIIVQGCAGSGKSMIMLHRLPILLYDNPNSLNVANIYIITPSASYIQQAQKMLYQLKISALPMGTLEQYYEHVISKYRRDLNECGKTISYKKLDSKTELYVYSKKCVDDIVALMNNAINEDTVEYKTGIEMLSLENDSSIQQRLENKGNKTFAEKISDQLIIYQKIIETNDHILRQYYNTIREAINAAKDLRNIMHGRKATVLRLMDRQQSKAHNDIEKLKHEISIYDKKRFKKAIERREKDIDSLTAIVEKTEKDRADLSKNEDYFLMLDLLVSDTDQALSIYSDFKYDIGQYKYRKELYSLIANMGKFSKQLTDVIDELAELDDPYSSYSNELVLARLAVKSSLISMDELNETFLKNEYIQSIVKANSDLQSLQKDLVLNVYKEIFNNIGAELDKDNNYKILDCSAYLFLQILYQYQGAPNAQSESLITIDEAQNLSVEEFSLIEKVNHDKVVLNLFGDIKQHFEDTKGIDDWSSVPQIASFQLSYLNENYRNARQITDYCNNRFHINMTAINWDGEGYNEFTDPEQYSEEISQILLHPHLEGISAIIVANQEETNYVNRIFPNFSSKINDMVTKNAPINEAKWNLMTINQAKGLEFRTVVAISGRMTENQKYVAYTRALDKLYIFDSKIELSNEDMINFNEKNEAEEKPDKNKKQSTSKGQSIKSVTKDQNSKLNSEQKIGKEVREFFENAGLKVVDQREKGGYLWVVGDESQIEKYVNEAVDKFEISGRYSSSKAINLKEGWFTNTKK